MEIIVTGADQTNPAVAKFLAALERGGSLSEPLRRIRRSIADYIVSYKNRAEKLLQVYRDADEYSIEELEAITRELSGRREMEVLAELKRLKSAYIDLVGGNIKTFLKSEVLHDQGFYNWVNGQTDLLTLIDLIVPDNFAVADGALKELKRSLGDLPDTIKAKGTVPNKTRTALKCLRDCKYQWEEESQLLDIYIEVMRDLSVASAVMGEVRCRIEKSKQKAVIDAFTELNK